MLVGIRSAIKARMLVGIRSAIKEPRTMPLPDGCEQYRSRAAGGDKFFTVGYRPNAKEAAPPVPRSEVDRRAQTRRRSSPSSCIRPIGHLAGLVLSFRTNTSSSADEEPTGCVIVVKEYAT
jgi:hypothetical protein